MSVESWHEERDRLMQLLEGIESGKITHIDEADLRELQATSPENIALQEASCETERASRLTRVSRRRSLPHRRRRHCVG